MQGNKPREMATTFHAVSTLEMLPLLTRQTGSKIELGSRRKVTK